MGFQAATQDDDPFKTDESSLPLLTRFTSNNAPKAFYLSHYIFYKSSAHIHYNKVIRNYVLQHYNSN
jgi:hypothetical protein